ncbi:TonB-dependent receptor [Emcibacter sp.]|uniref:TonB-dependent receptor n=1 Tax=Emcibacter sp. TaxID=1979954 RepID=UPI002AA7E7EA|nr:TonB-dependent receptor [Emcibacter sp.]
MTYNRKNILATSTALAILMPFSAAFAADEENLITLEEIVVTSQYREQRLQEVPVAVTAFTSSDIANAGISSTQDFIDMTPNMTLDDSFTYGNTFVVLRGVTQINNADSPVAIVVDGVPQNNQKQFKMDLFDIERIEVLKGPQGALYGRNAIGGAINIVTKQPTNEMEGKVTAGISNGVGFNLDGVVSGPIVEDKVLFRVAGSYRQTDGLINNDFLDQKADFVDHDYSFRGKLDIRASDNLTLDLRASYRKYQAGSSYDVPVRHNGDPTIRDGSANDIFNPNENILGLTNGETAEFTAKIDLETEYGVLTSITGYTDLKEYYRADIDFSNQAFDPTFGGFAGLLGFLDSIGAFPTPAGTIGIGQGQDLDLDLLSQEVRFVSPDEDRFRYILGGFFIHTNRDLHTRLFADVTGERSQIDDPSLVFVNSQESNSNDAWSLFGQAEYDLTDKLMAQVSLRYDEDSREQTDPVSGLVRERTFTSVQPKATLTYQFNEDSLGYATYSTGFRSGGFNAPVVTFPVFEDETLTNYELGAKTSWFDNRLVLNAAVFYSNSDDFQFFFLDLATGQQIIQNLEDVAIWGLDIDFQAALTEDIKLFGGIGYTDTEIKKVGSEDLIAGLTSAGVDMSLVVGSRTPKTTDWTINAGIQYDFEVTDAIEGMLRFDYEYRGKKYWQIDNQDVQDPIHMINLRATASAESWSVSAYVKNLLNERYYTDFNPGEFLGLAIDVGYPGRPRVYGAEATFRF